MPGNEHWYILGFRDHLPLNATKQARAANRRVEIGIVDSKLITNGPLVVPK